MNYLMVMFSFNFLFTGTPARLCGDGRYDSPGHSSRYCTYTMIDAVSTFCLALVNLSFSHFEKFVVKLILGCLTTVASFLLSFKGFRTSISKHDEGNSDNHITSSRRE